MAPWSSNVISYRTAIFRQVNKDKAYTHQNSKFYPARRSSREPASGDQSYY